MRARRKNRQWSPEDEAYLTENYATMSASAIAAHLSRTTVGIWKRAERLGLTKQNLSQFKPGHVPANKGQRKGEENMPLVRKVIEQLEEHGELTQKELASLIGCLDSSVSSALQIIRRPGQRGAFVSRWEWKSARHWVSKYRLGHGQDAPRPRREREVQITKDDPYKIQPVPRPAAYLWGHCIAAQAA